MSGSGSWAPFGPSEPDPPKREPEDEPVPVEEPPAAPAPVEEPEPASEPPPAAFAPPVAQPLPTLPEPSSLGWPAPPQPDPPPEPAGQQAPWPPGGFQTPRSVPSSATVALVLGILSLVLCGFVGPFAIHYGLRARREIDADPALGGRGLASWGLALGIVSTAFLVIGLALVAAGVIALT